MRRVLSSSRSALALPAAITLASCAAVACSLVYSSDLNDAHDGVPPQGSSGGSEAGVAEAGSSNGSSGEAGADASSSGLPRGCGAYKPTPKFCKDFDTDTTVGADWDAVLTEGGQVSLARTFWWSQPAAAHIVEKTVGNCKYTRLDKTFPNTGTKRISASFRFRPISPWQADGNLPFLIAYDQDGLNCAAILSINGRPDNKTISSTNLNMQSGNPQNNDVRDLNGAPQLDLWTDITFSAVPAVNGDGVELTIRYDYENGGKDETTLNFPQCRVRGSLGVYPGFHCGTGNGEVYFDDIRVDWE